MKDIDSFGSEWDYLGIKIVKKPEDNIFLNIIDFATRGIADIIMRFVEIFAGKL
jgi:hypothetical protein